MGKRGPPPWKPTPEDVAQVKLLAGLGMTQEQCARLIGVGEKTFRAQPDVKEAFEEGKAYTISKVAGKLVSQALKGDTTSAIFYLKTQAGWKETTTLELTRPEPLEFHVIDVEERRALPPPDNSDG